MPEPVIEIPARYVKSLSWDGDDLVDYVGGGNRYHLDGSFESPPLGFAYRFDSAVQSPSGRYAFIYERLGTKGIITDWQECNAYPALVEVNRSYYNADSYEFPVCLFALPDGQEVIAHCPEAYNRVDIDELGSCRRLTDRQPADPIDFFHSRLAATPDGRWLLSAGWVWHPIDDLVVYDVRRALTDPHLLDTRGSLEVHRGEVSSATFIGSNRLIVALREDNHKWRGGRIEVYDLESGALLSSAPLEREAGTLMPVGQDYAVGFYGHPHLIQVATGRIVHRWGRLSSGQQNSSIMGHLDYLPPVALDPAHGRFAVAGEGVITVANATAFLPPGA